MIYHSFLSRKLLGFCSAATAAAIALSGCNGGNNGPGLPTNTPTPTPILTAAPGATPTPTTIGAPSPTSTAVPSGAATGRIIYTVGSGLENNPRNIYSIAAAGGARFQITRNGADNSQASVSRDGRKVVWLRNDTRGNLQLRVANTDGSGERGLNMFGLHPALSDDGQKIVFSASRAGEKPGLRLVNTDGTGLKRIDVGDLALVEYPAFDPTGRRIVFSGVTPRTPSGGNSGPIGPISIYTINSDGTSLKRLTSTFTNDVYPEFSPDGRKIVFESGSGVGGSGRIVMINADGSGRRQISRDTDDREPTFSPDGRQVAFVSSDAGRSGIFRMNLDGSRRVAITQDASFNAEPSWGR